MRNLKERKLDMTGFSPHFKILEKLKQTEEQEQTRSSMYQAFEEIEFSKATVERSTGFSENHKIKILSSSTFKPNASSFNQNHKQKTIYTSWPLLVAVLDLLGPYS